MMKTTFKIPAVALDRAALEIVEDKYRVLYLDNARADKCFWKNGEYIVEDMQISEWNSIENLLTK